MAKLESAKEEIGWLKVVFAVLVAMDASLIAWVAQSPGSGLLFMAALAAVVVLTVAVVWINHTVYRTIHELENL